MVPGFYKAPPLIDAPRPARILAAGGVCALVFAGAFALGRSSDESGVGTAKPERILRVVPAAVVEPLRLGVAHSLPPLGEVRASLQAQRPATASADQVPPAPLPALPVGQADPPSAPAAPTAPEPDSPPLLFDDSG